MKLCQKVGASTASVPATTSVARRTLFRARSLAAQRGASGRKFGRANDATPTASPADRPWNSDSHDAAASPEQRNRSATASPRGLDAKNSAG